MHDGMIPILPAIFVAVAAAEGGDWVACNAKAPAPDAPDRQAFMLHCLNERLAAHRAEAAKLAKKPGAALGMTQQQVLNETAWGKPRKVNRTVTAAGVHEQWVYNGGFLYFLNGRLTAIEN
jgi:hypothetical protein